MDGNLTPDTRINPAALRLTPEAAKAAEQAVERTFEALERSNTSLPDWADYNLFGAIFGRIRKKQARLASEMTLKEFGAELSHIVQDVVETASDINTHRPEKTGTHIDVETLAQQIQSVADVALAAAQAVMQQNATVTSCETHPAR